MAAKTKIGADVTIGIALGVLVQAILKSLNIEVDEATAPIIGAGILALMTRFGIKLKERADDKNFRSRENKTGKLS